MPSIATVLAKFTNQTMLYWQKTASDGSGRPVYADPRNPVPVSVRWEDVQKEVITAMGRKQLSKAYILSATPLVVGSLVFLGGGAMPITDWQLLPGYPNPPTVSQGGREVIVCKQTPDITGTSFIYESYL